MVAIKLRLLWCNLVSGVKKKKTNIIVVSGIFGLIVTDYFITGKCAKPAIPVYFSMKLSSLNDFFFANVFLSVDLKNPKME